MGEGLLTGTCTMYEQLQDWRKCLPLPVTLNYQGIHADGQESCKHTLIVQKMSINLWGTGRTCNPLSFPWPRGTTSCRSPSGNQSCWHLKKTKATSSPDDCIPQYAYRYPQWIWTYINGTVFLMKSILIFDFDQKYICRLLKTNMYLYK